ncbi:hypothetical protein V8D89_000640 [Ganoderma adspersum]
MLAIEESTLVMASTEKLRALHPGSLKVAGEILVEEEVVVTVPEDSPPDGGLRAWLVVFGVCIGMGAITGPIEAWGVSAITTLEIIAWQAYYEEDLLRTKSSSGIAWIGSVQSAMGYSPGLIVGRLFDLGYFRLPVFASSVLFVACMFLTAECTQYWQFLLCQGFGMGITSGVFFNIGSMVLTHWFKKRLGLALAIVYSGTSVFGCIVSILMKFLLQRMSFQWATRILGFITLGLLVLTTLTAVQRLPGTRDLGPLFNLAEFKKPVYSFYVLSLVINNLALNSSWTYITVSAVDAGVDANFSYDLVTIVNAVATVGQLGGGLLADRYEPLDVLICSTLLAAAVNFAWPFATNVATLAVVAILIGLSTGGVYASMVQPFERMGPLVDVGLRIGMGFTLITAGMVAGSPLSGAIFDATGSYKNMGYYGGSILVLSAALMVVTKHFVVKSAEEEEAGKTPGEEGQSRLEPAPPEL